ncbi:MAG: SLC13 family permease [Microthrixaceae bacterium]|nr:SLC13 family permease [Microthrixaceae bacterium]MCO5313300.1 SLC13 family permease [Microthrixaceae bacterium]HPB45812.1 SLC13 family permease [Microthrixaceae bacterium]
MTDAAVALLVLGGVIALFMANRFPVGSVAVATSLTLWATGLLTFDEAVAGFGDPVVIFIATLFIVSEAIDANGLTTWAGQRVVAIAGDNMSRVLVSIMALCAVLTALISLNGSVAALLPMAVMLAMKLKVPPSRLLMPMVYAGSAGSMLVLMGSPVNVIVSDAASEVGEGAFGFFEFAVLGVPLLIATMLIGALLTRRLVPDRQPVSAPPDLSRHAHALASHYQLSEGFYRLRVRDKSPLIGRKVASLRFDDHPTIDLIATQGADGLARAVEHVLEPDDVLVVSGTTEHVSTLAVADGLAVALSPASPDSPDTLIGREAGVAEVVVPPRSPLIDETMFPGMVRGDDLVILAIQRYGRDFGDKPVKIAAGDSILVWGSWDSVDGLVTDRDVLIVDSPDLMRRQAGPLGKAATRTAIIVGAMVLSLAFGLVPPAGAGLIAALALVLSGSISSAQAYRAVSWETVVLVGGLIPMSAAIQSSGAADSIAERVIDLVGSGSPMLLMLALFALTAVLGLVISNTATVLIVLPVALSVAAETGYAAKPVLMLIAVASSAAVLTPVQTPGNMMVMAPAGYRFSDYWRLGAPVLLAWLAIALVVIPIMWPFAP